MGFRFIAPSTSTWSKDLSDVLKCGLEAVQRDIERDDTYTLRYKGFKRNWILKDGEAVKDALENLKRDSRNTVNSYDFGTMFTSLPIPTVKEKIGNLIRASFARAGGRKYLYVPTTRKSAYTHWAATETKAAAATEEALRRTRNGEDEKDLPRTHFTKDQLLEVLELFLENALFSVGDLLYQQIQGVFMGASASPAIANLTLHSFEGELIDSYDRTVSSKPELLKRRFLHFYRFIDDLLVINCTNAEFRGLAIYPAELQLGLESMSPDRHTSFLDMEIHVQEGRFSYQLYDKRRRFPFRATRFMHSRTCARRMTFLGVIKGQLLRILRRCQTVEHIKENVNILKDDLRARGFGRSWLPQVLSKRHREKWALLRRTGVAL